MNCRKTLILVTTIMSLIWGTTLQASRQELTLDIIPKPLFMATSPGSFLFDAQTSIFAGEGTGEVANYLAQRIHHATGLQMRVRTEGIEEGTNRIVFQLDDSETLMNTTRKEGYRLSVTEESVSISAVRPAGLFYGVQTLLQLLPPKVYSQVPINLPLSAITLPLVEISDRPRFPWRGLMIDVSRHFFSKEQLIKTIDAMALHKLNVLHLHLTDDPGWRIEIERYPNLVNIGSIGDYSNSDGPERLYFSKDEMREIIAHAGRHHIAVVPEIDMPGHAGAAARAYPEFFDGEKTFNPGNEATYEFVMNVLGEIVELFPSPYIHFGGDEVRNHRWDQLPEVRQLMQNHGYTTLREVEGHFDRFVADYIASQNRIPIGWDEVVEFDINLATVIQWWRHRHPDALFRAVSKGHHVILSPTNYTYFDYPNDVAEPGAPWEGNDNGPNSFELILQWEPVPDSFTIEEEGLVLGLQANLWTELVKTNEYFEYMVYPRLSALAEIAWSPKGQKNVDDFVRRLRTQCLRYSEMGLNYREFGERSVDFRYLAH